MKRLDIHQRTKLLGWLFVIACIVFIWYVATHTSGEICVPQYADC